METAAAPAPLSVEAELAQMRAMMATLLERQQAPTAPVAPPRTVAELYDAYVASFGADVPKWARNHRRFFTDFKFDYQDQRVSLGYMPWTRLTPQIGHAWWAELREQTRKMKGKIEPVSASYCNRIRTTGAGMFTWHRKQADKTDSRVQTEGLFDNVTENPIHRWPRAGKDELGGRMAGFEDEEQLTEFLKHANPTLAEMMTLSVWCGGMRKGEVRELRFAYINWGSRSITLPAEFVKNGVERTFPVSEACMAILERRRATRRSEFVFPSPMSASGAPLAESTMDGWIHDARQAWGKQLNGDEDVVFHHCRHTFAKWQLILGLEATTVMEFGGWLSFEVFKGYAKSNQAMFERARAKTQGRSIREAVAEAAGRNSAPATRRSAHRARARFEDNKQQDTEAAAAK